MGLQLLELFFRGSLATLEILPLQGQGGGYRIGMIGYINFYFLFANKSGK